MGLTLRELSSANKSTRTNCNFSLYLMFLWILKYPQFILTREYNTIIKSKSMYFISYNIIQKIGATNVKK